MIPNKKYEKNKITQFTKNRIIIRKGGYFPRRLLITSIAFISIAVIFISLFFLHIDIWFLLLYPIICLGLIVQYFYKNHIRFGEKISINKKRLAIELYGTNTKKVQFRKDSIKSMTCLVSGLYYQFIFYKTNNSSISFSIYDSKKRNPLSAIVKIYNLKKMVTTNSNEDKVLRYWSKSKHHLRTPKEIKNVSESLYEYRSDYFTLTYSENNLNIQTIEDQVIKICLNNNSGVLEYTSNTSEVESLAYNDILSIEKNISETSPITSSNRITINIVANLSNGKSVPIIHYKTHEPIPADMDIIELNQDFNNLLAIIDMNIKESLDEKLEILDLDGLPDHEPILSIKSQEKK